MIKNFGDRETEKVYNQVFSKKLPQEIRRRCGMSAFIETPKISEILNEEFMKPLGISAYKLAHEIHVPVSRIQDILHDRRKITADTSLRLARYFGVSDRYFLDIQNDIEIREVRLKMVADINDIKPYDAAVM